MKDDDDNQFVNITIFFVIFSVLCVPVEEKNHLSCMNLNDEIYFKVFIFTFATRIYEAMVAVVLN